MKDAGKCPECGCQFGRENLRYVSGSIFCAECMAKFVQEKLIRPSENPNLFLLTEAGEREFPGLKVVAYCSNDGSAIYQRWVFAGIAHLGEKPLCPFCLGKGHDAMNCWL
jgi:hypothetical protein